MTRSITIIKYLLVTTLFLIGGFSQISAQCTFNCNDTIHVSVNNMCMATITPDMLLEGDEPAPISCNYAIELKTAAGAIITTAPTVGSQYVGQFLTARIYELGKPNSTSCWTVLKIEDKLPPKVVCINRDTLNCTISKDLSVLEAYIKSEIEKKLVDNCNNRTVDIEILGVTQTKCDTGFAATRIVEYAVLQSQTVIKTCKDTFYYERIKLDTISPPKNFTESMVLPCTSPYPTVPFLLNSTSTHRELPGFNSLPNFKGRSLFDYTDSLFVERGFCNLKMTYSDQVLQSCGTSYKIVRTWTVIDWCNAENRTFFQVIKVVDNSIRIASGCNNILDQKARATTCTASVLMTPPTVATDECSTWSYTIFVREPDGSDFVQFGGSRNSVASVNREFGIGISRVRYVVRDACDNETTCEFNVEVKDKDEPHAVCDAVTVVTLNDNFFGKAFARSIDDNSFDDCGSIVSMKVRRMDRATTACPTPADYDDFVKFCCEDVGKSIMVEFRVVDDSGYENVCMSEIMVQYKGLGPQIICPNPLAIQDCRDFATFDINKIVAPIVSSSNICLANSLTPLIRETNRSLDSCGNGFIEIEWVLNYTGTEEVVCSERILFEPKGLFNESNINWPADRTVQGCTAAAPTQAEYNNLLDDVACSNVVFSEPVDQVFNNVSGFCKKIQRTWTVVDWCRYPANPQARWSYVQTIAVTNLTAPVFDESVADILIQDNQDNCRATVDFSGLASDDCSALSDLKWSYRLELVSGSQRLPIATGNTRDFSRVLDYGNYRINYTAMDECGNISERFRDFELEDNAAPEITCSSIVRDISADTLNPNVQININNLINTNRDNCDPEPSIGMRIAGTFTLPTNSLSFTCDDLGVTQIEVISTDESGNSASCIAFVDIRDGNGTCGFGASTVTVSGSVMTANKVAVENAGVSLVTSLDAKGFETSFDGNYAFGDLPKGTKLQISAEKKNDYLNGVSTLDIVLIQRHILGVKEFDKVQSLIAADVNMNKSISSTDLVILRKLLLGQIESFSHENSWLFIPAQNFPQDIAKPYAFDPRYSIDGLNEDMVSADFMAIKLGDVDNNAIANSKLSKKRSDGYVMFQQTKSGKEININVTEDMIIAGLQLVIDLPKQLKLEQVASSLPRFSPDMVNIVEGKLYFSWSDLKDALVVEELPLLTLSFDRVVDQSISLNSDWDNELYTKSLQTKTIRLDDSFETNDEFFVEQNIPNPFNVETNISFNLGVASEVELSIVDINGTVVYRKKSNYPKGKSQIGLRLDELRLNKGIYYYMLKTQKRSLIKKMMIF